MAVMWKIQQLSELYIEEPGAGKTCSDSNGTKALGLKYSSPPLAYRSPRLSTAFLFSSLCSVYLCALFYSPPIRSFAVSYTLMVFLVISLPAVSVLHLPLTAQLPGQLQPQTTLPTPISSFTRALTLSFYLVFAVNRDSQGSLGMLRDSKWGVRVQSTSFLFHKDIVICLQALIRWLIHTSDLIISLRGTRRVFKTVADQDHPFHPSPQTHMHAAHSWSAVTSTMRYFSHKG